MKKLHLFLILALLPLLIKAQWSTSPSENTQVTNLNGEQCIPKIGHCPNGDIYIAYFSPENGNYNVRAQRYDYQGNQIWQDNGMLISDNPSMSWLTDWDMTADKEGNMVLAFQDIRDGEAINNIYAYKISPSGEFMWGGDGFLVSHQGEMNVSPKICITEANNVVIAYQSDYSTYCQKYSPTGQLLWTNAMVETGTLSYTWPQLMPVGNDDFIMKYYEDSGPSYSPTRHLYVQRYNSEGTAVWAEPAPISTAGGISAWTQILSMKNDGNDGVFIAWHDGRNSDWNSYSYIQYVSANGEVKFTPNGVLLSTIVADNQFYPKIAVPENGECVYIFWKETDGAQNQHGIFGQKVSFNGDIMWDDFGKPFFNIGETFYNIVEARSIDNDVILFYEKENGINCTSINAMRVDTDGNTVWQQENVAITSAISEKVHIFVSEQTQGQWLLAWEDDRNNDNTDIYAQNISPEGDLGPITIVETGIIEGNITFQYGEADMSLTTISDGTNTYTPDNNGHFSFEITTGEHTITFSNPYTTTVEEIVTIEANQTETLNITLDIINTDITIKAIDQSNTPLIEYGLIVNFELQAPDGTTYSGSIDEENYLLECAPCGHYTGTATYEGLSEPVNITAYIDYYFNTITFNFIITSLIETETQNGLSVYPNPMSSSSFVKIQLSEPQSGSFSLTDIKGNTISRSDRINFQAKGETFLFEELFNVKYLSSGVYQIEFNGEKQHYLTKVIVK